MGKNTPTALRTGELMLGFQAFLFEEKMKLASSNLKSFSYNEEDELLDVWFRSGGVYRYSNIPRDVVDEMKFAESRGRYFWQNIRTNPDYPYTKLKHWKPGFQHAFNTSKGSTAQRHLLKTPADAPWQG